MEQRNNVRERILQQYRNDKVPVVIIMRNGFQMRGAIINEFDDCVIAADYEGAEQMLYDTAISTIAPIQRRPVRPNQHYTDATWDSPARGFLRDP